MQYFDDRTSAPANFAVLRLRYVAHSSLVEISSIRGNRHQSSVQLLRAIVTPKSATMSKT